MSLEPLFSWFTEEIQYVLFFIIIVLLMVAVFKRAWLFAVGVLIAGSIIGIFVLNPDLILGLSEWFNKSSTLGSELDINYFLKEQHYVSAVPYLIKGALYAG